MWQLWGGRAWHLGVCCVLLVLVMSCGRDPFDPQMQLAKDEQIITDYLKDKKITAQADSVYGIRFVIHAQGSGSRPQVSDVININYEGRLLANGEVFDSGDNKEFQLQRLISGWKILLPYIREGGNVTMYLPSGYAYGHTGSDNIPADACLIFDVKLNFIKH